MCASRSLFMDSQLIMFLYQYVDLFLYVSKTQNAFCIRGKLLLKEINSYDDYWFVCIEESKCPIHACLRKINNCDMHVLSILQTSKRS